MKKLILAAAISLIALSIPGSAFAMDQERLDQLIEISVEQQALQQSFAEQPKLAVDDMARFEKSGDLDEERVEKVESVKQIDPRKALSNWDYYELERANGRAE